MRFAKQRKWRRKQPTFAEYLARMPNVGRDSDFARRDAWFREQVQASIDDPRPSVPDDDARLRFAARRAALRQRAR